MIRTTHLKLSILAASVIAAAAAHAASPRPAPAEPVAVKLRVATGRPGKGFSRVFADIQSVCGNEVPMVEVETEGGLQNLTRLAENKADIGFAQVDTLLDLRSSDPTLAELQMVMPLNSNLLHVLTSTNGFQPAHDGLGGSIKDLLNKVRGTDRIDVTTMTDLKGLKVAVVGSARALGREVSNRNHLALQFVDAGTDEEALSLLRRGIVAAVMSSAGWPSGPVQALHTSDHIQLLSYDLKVTDPYQTATRNYENIDAYRVKFLAAPNLLLTRPFASTGPYGQAVSTLRSCIQRNLQKLKEGPYEPAWLEVRAETPSYEGLQVFGASAR